MKIDHREAIDIIDIIDIIDCLNRWKSILTMLVLVDCYRLYRFSSIVIDYHRFSSILACNSWKMIPSIFRLAPGTCFIYSLRVRSNMYFVNIFNFVEAHIICDSQGTCNLHFCNCAISHAFSSSSKNIHRKTYWCSGSFLNAFFYCCCCWDVKQRCYRFTELKNRNGTVNKAI